MGERANKQTGEYVLYEIVINDLENDKAEKGETE